MNKYDAFKQWVYNNWWSDYYEKFEEFELEWESGKFNEEPKGECCG